MSNFMTTRAQLARLLATENLIVEHSAEAETAAFNTEDRVLTLPILKTENENVYNMFVAHECAHALWTPVDWAARVPNNIPFDFVNVIEDVRIERFIQNKFPGLRRDFTKGYDELSDKDFFGIVGRDLSDFSFIDRINLHFKLGARALVPFTDEEQVYVTAVDEADTFDKVCLVAKMIRDFVNQPKEKEEPKEGAGQTTDGSGEQPGQNDGDQGESVDESGDRETESKSSGMNSDDDEDGDIGGTSDPLSGAEKFRPEVDEFKSETQQEFDEQLRQMSKDHTSNSPVVYINLPNVKLEDVMIDVKTLRESFQVRHNGFLDNTREEYNKFMSSIKRDVNFMVQQFEMRKSADAYARQQTNKTGVLDTHQLHNYKLTDDIFLRQTITPDGKNHGMMMLVDWSGSMSDNIVSVIKQLIILVQFCRKVQIPFEVYSFTSGRRPDREDDNRTNNEISMASVEVVQILTSTAKNREIDTDLFNLFGQARALGTHHPSSVYSTYLDMGGTPLNNSMFLIPQMVKLFRARTKAQKVSFCVLTDGESSPLYYWQERQSSYDGSRYFRPTYSFYEKLMLRDGYNVIPMNEEYSPCVQTGMIANYLQNSIEEFSIFNIFMGSAKTCNQYLRDNGGKFDEKLFKKENACTSNTDGWPMISVISPKAFGEAQEEIQVEAGAKKGQIKTALKKFLASKQSSKNLLTRIVASFA